MATTVVHGRACVYAARMLTELIVPADARGLRLDVWLTERLDGCTRSLVSRLINQGLCQVSTPARKILKLKAGLTLDGGEQVALEIPEDEPMEARPEDIPLTLLHEDAHLIASDKPAGMVVHPAKNPWMHHRAVRQLWIHPWVEPRGESNDIGRETGLPDIHSSV